LILVLDRKKLRKGRVSLSVRSRGGSFTTHRSAIWPATPARQTQHPPTNRPRSNLKGARYSARILSWERFAREAGLSCSAHMAQRVLVSRPRHGSLDCRTRRICRRGIADWIEGYWLLCEAPFQPTTTQDLRFEVTEFSSAPFSIFPSNFCALH